MNEAQLRAAIDTLQITQAELAKLLQIDPRTLRRFIARNNASPIPKTVDYAVRYLLLREHALPADLAALE